MSEVNIDWKHLKTQGRFASLTVRVKILIELMSPQWFMYHDSDLFSVIMHHYAVWPQDWVLNSRDYEYRQWSCSERAGPSRLDATNPRPFFISMFFASLLMRLTCHVIFCVGASSQLASCKEPDSVNWKQFALGLQIDGLERHVIDDQEQLDRRADLPNPHHLTDLTKSIKHFF